MPKNDRSKTKFIIRCPENDHWLEIAALIAYSLPHALVSKLGTHFGALYYEHISNSQGSCCYAAFDNNGRFAGMILGTLDRNKAKSISFTLKTRLLLAANIRLFSPAVCWWLLSGLRTRRSTKVQMKEFPKAELIIVTVHEEFKGNHLAKLLINQLEKFFRKNNLQTPYLILTEKSNRVANDFYKKLGAKFIKTYAYHDKIINEWHKSLS